MIQVQEKSAVLNNSCLILFQRLQQCRIRKYEIPLTHAFTQLLMFEYLMTVLILGRNLCFQCKICEKGY